MIYSKKKLITNSQKAIEKEYLNNFLIVKKLISVTLDLLLRPIGANKSYKNYLKIKNNQFSQLSKVKKKPINLI